ncbi:hypothetical protein Y886_34560 [Xanthomonas hyacinthi DSM 19077]|nr:hypothetical protein Y886_34560 [Xanthomonas hyacinthi DSM 19077]
MHRGQLRVAVDHAEQDSSPAVPVRIETQAGGIGDGQGNPPSLDISLSGRAGEWQGMSETLVRLLTGAGHRRGIAVCMWEHVASRLIVGPSC